MTIYLSLVITSVSESQNSQGMRREDMKKEMFLLKGGLSWGKQHVTNICLLAEEGGGNRASEDRPSTKIKVRTCSY